MSDILPWLEYRWSFDFPTGMYRAFLECLRGTPARLEEMVRTASREALVRRPTEGEWSALEHAGHLWVLDGLHHARVEQYLRGETSLVAADMTNRETFDSDFNRMAPEEVLKRFRGIREKEMRLLDGLTLSDAARVATHPRLKMAMRLVDMCFFAAEHDDHHLAVAQELLRGAR